MNRQKALMIIPDISPEEMLFLMNLLKGFKEEEVEQFLFLYKGKRRTTQEVMLMTLIGFLGIAGIQRFMLKQTGFGIIYLLTFGFCYIGTIVDLVNHRSMTDSYNYQMAIESTQLMQMYKHQ